MFQISQLQYSTWKMEKESQVKKRQLKTRQRKKKVVDRQLYDLKHKRVQILMEVTSLSDCPIFFMNNSSARISYNSVMK